MFKVQQLFPLLLAVASYFNHYFIGLFDQTDGFEFVALVILVLQFYLFWCVFPVLNKKVDYITSKNSSRQLNKQYKLLCLIVSFLLCAVAISVGINFLLKLYFIYVFNNAPVISWLHFTVYSLLGILNGGMILAVRLYLDSQSSLQRQKEQLRVMRQENERAQLNLLQAQVDPHFLFNNLNTLYSLINQDSKMASDYLLHLSGYLRRSFEQLSSPLIPLTKELMELEHYLEILKIRFADCFDVVIIEECQDLRAQLPPMSLAELIENAVKHNEINEACPLMVTITIFSDNIEVKNSCNKKTDVYSNGVGLDNLNKRVKLLTNKPLTITQSIEEFIVRVPLVNEKQWAG